MGFNLCFCSFLLIFSLSIIFLWQTILTADALSKLHTRRVLTEVFRLLHWGLSAGWWGPAHCNSSALYLLSNFCLRLLRWLSLLCTCVLRFGCSSTCVLTSPGFALDLSNPRTYASRRNYLYTVYMYERNWTAD